MSTDLQPQPAGFDRSRLRSLAPIAVFDIAGPLAVYYLARMAGTTQVMALILSGIVPAAGIVISAVLRDPAAPWPRGQGAAGSALALR